MTNPHPYADQDPMPDQPETLETADPLAPEPQDVPSIQDTDDAAVKIDILTQELDRTKDQLMRALAEMENTRKRALREREDASKYAVSGFARDLLSVADNLRRALQAIPQALVENNPEVKNLVSGIEVTEREMLRSFEKNGIQKIEPLDQTFDPHLHEVMFEAPIPGKESGVIIQVVEPGYTLHGRILRPARVGVSKNDAGPAQHIVDTQA